ncbi:MAG: c-type cytochrome [Cyanobacteria bacterium P01_C01_bin.38]
MSKEESVVKPVAMATPNPEGAKLFSQNCAACHAGGNNLVNAQKTLKKQALEKYDMYSEDAIVYQVVNGKNVMPAFGRRLSSEQIEHLAQYVLAQADKGW